MVEHKIYELLKPEYITRFSVLGGEPLIHDNLKQLNYMLCTIKSNYPDIKIWIWTGYTWDELVAGPFVQKEKDLTLKWRGSRNQEIIDLQETIKQGKKVLYDI